MTGKKITELFAWVILGADGGEGIPAIDGKNGFMMPLVGIDRAKMESFRGEAQRLADIGCTIELRRYGGTIETLEVLTQKAVARG